MKASAKAAAKAEKKSQPLQDSPALSQLKEAIDVGGKEVVDAIAAIEDGDGEVPATTAGEGGVEAAATEGDVCVSPESKDAPPPHSVSPSYAKCLDTSNHTTTPIITPLDREIAACGERIVRHSVEISELKAALKNAKKSWETASDEQAELIRQKVESEIAVEERIAREGELDEQAELREATEIADNAAAFDRVIADRAAEDRAAEDAELQSSVEVDDI